MGIDQINANIANGDWTALRRCLQQIKINLGTSSGTFLSGYLLADGSRALTAAWDAGSFQIRAETFQSDVATGTAPFTVASTTLVANLNAALLEGNAASAFATAAHLHDTQTLQCDGIASDGGAFSFDCSGALSLNPNASGNVNVFGSAASGETKSFRVYGYRAADALRYLDIAVGVDAAQSFSFDLDTTNYLLMSNAVCYAGRLAGSLSSGANSTFFGITSGYSNTGAASSGFGVNAVRDNTGANVTGFGYFAGYQNSGDRVSAIGVAACSANSGDDILAFGASACQNNTQDRVTAGGSLSGQNNTGYELTSYGYRSGASNTGTSCLFYGPWMGNGNTLAYRVLIGNNDANTVPWLAGYVDTGEVHVGDGAGSGYTPAFKISGYPTGESLQTVSLGQKAATDGVFLFSGVTDVTQFAFDQDVDVTGDITVSGTVDGRDVAADGATLDALSGASAAAAMAFSWMGF
jgi:hypothetical protein